MRKCVVSLLVLVAASVSGAEAADKAEEPATAGETRRVRLASAPPVKQNTYRVRRMQDNPTIDADWNKPAWKSVAPVTLEYYMGQEPAHQPKVQARAAYDDRYLYVIWKVADNYVLARRTRHMQDVWRDSCVELFFTPGGDPQDRGYFNLETNATGIKWFAAHVPGPKVEKGQTEQGGQQEAKGRKAEQFTAEDFASIVTAASLKSPIDPEIAMPTTWTLEYKIPLDLLEKHAKVDRPKPGVTWRANFYKCADDSSHPHWLTWSPVHHATPSFHLPEYFGVLAFE